MLSLYLCHSHCGMCVLTTPFPNTCTLIKWREVREQCWCPLCTFILTSTQNDTHGTCVYIVHTHTYTHQHLGGKSGGCEALGQPWLPYNKSEESLGRLHKTLNKKTKQINKWMNKRWTIILGQRGLVKFLRVVKFENFQFSHCSYSHV